MVGVKPYTLFLEFQGASGSDRQLDRIESASVGGSLSYLMIFK